MHYHSALTQDVKVEPCNRFEKDGNIAFVHDLWHGIADEFKLCSVLYTEIPWQAGLKKFDKRANIGQERHYADFLHKVGLWVTQLHKPTVIVLGKQSIKYLPIPDFTYTTEINKAPAIANVYGTRLTNITDEYSIIQQLLQAHHSIGDFCCGYGRVAKIAKEMGKNFVMSDYNPKCIGYIQQEYDKW